jgi:hypothetical protein
MYFKVALIAIITSLSVFYSMYSGDWNIARIGMIFMVLASCFVGHQELKREKETIKE